MQACTHLGNMRPVVPSADGCEDCLAIGSSWVHLRLCMTCGHVGCCEVMLALGGPAPTEVHP